MNLIKSVNLANTTAKMPDRINLTRLSRLIADYNVDHQHCSEIYEKINKMLDGAFSSLPRNVESMVLSLDHSSPEKIVFSLMYNYKFNSEYDATAKLIVTITPTFSGFNINLTGKDHDHLSFLKSLLYDLFE